MKISEILLKYDTDKNRGATKNKNGHYYGETYDKLFSNFDNESKLNILEIGVEKGGSLESWKEYFPNSNIYGVDILDSRIYKNENITFILSDIKNITNEFDNIIFDIIIDDGSHYLPDVLFVVNNYIDKLSDNGILIIEDVQSITWKNEIEKINKNFEIEFIDLSLVNGYYDDRLFVIRKKNK